MEEATQAYLEIMLKDGHDKAESTYISRTIFQWLQKQVPGKIVSIVRRRN